MTKAAQTSEEAVNGDRPADRITQGLLRLNTAMRNRAWNWAEGAGLTPTQGEILVLLMQRRTALRLNDIARETALTAATTSDAVSTLEEKGLVEKRRATDDRRALAVKLTARGRTAAKRAAQWPGFVSGALGSLRDEEQTALYSGLFKLIRELEIQGTMPAHRMCGTCRWFETGATAEAGTARRGARAATKATKATAASPAFRCTTLSQPLDRSSLRLDCLAYEAADVATQARHWKILKQA
ncbi:MarR family winged helix-turn-helix transcriptional regulator [Pararobbsia silviterrae]|uniref:MarR family transcriptional regulator n=1 Tax=Pararobbsia silviterrae TaxID=1792498 RepID=A0A494YCQ6_9BURK|nr:MarR family winged helix-turn-helix transcriptional regulator [Pararobbsia silviterrae]RKP58508.1 MarR family transcriptional regulator [Pararobbsia silviterrae]